MKLKLRICQIMVVLAVVLFIVSELYFNIRYGWHFINQTKEENVCSLVFLGLMAVAWLLFTSLLFDIAVLFIEEHEEEYDESEQVTCTSDHE